MERLFPAENSTLGGKEILEVIKSFDANGDRIVSKCFEARAPVTLAQAAISSSVVNLSSCSLLTARGRESITSPTIRRKSCRSTRSRLANSVTATRKFAPRVTAGVRRSDNFNQSEKL